MDFALRFRIKTFTLFCLFLLVLILPGPVFAQESVPTSTGSTMLMESAVLSSPTQPVILSPTNGLRSPSYYHNIKVRISADTTLVTLYLNSASRFQLTPGGMTEVIFSNVQLAEGLNYIQVKATNAAGTAYSPVNTLTVVVTPAIPQVTTHINNQVVLSPAAIGGLADPNTTFIECFLNNQYVGTCYVNQFSQFSFPALSLNYGGNRIDLVAYNEFYSTPLVFYLYMLDFEAADQTALIIDKSDFRIWYIVNGALDCSFPIAIGRVGMSTPSAEWIVGDKHYCDPGSVYGPRKLRLYRLTYSRRYRGRRGRRVLVSSGYSYQRTRYGVHGTNQPWVIGTRASHGCIRLYNEDILYLFDRVPIGTRVVTRD